MYPYIKHLLDKVLALVLLIALLPILLLIILCYLPSFDVFFIQERIGRGENQFKIFKFRTLIRKEGKDSERKYFLGNILRSSSMDELPQLINVIKGEMSMIGPRPLLPEYLQYYTEVEKKRHTVKPGITGWAQVNGRNLLSWEKRFSLDVYYVENMSLKLDLLIMVKTILTLFKRGENTEQERFYRRNSNS